MYLLRVLLLGLLGAAIGLVTGFAIPYVGGEIIDYLAPNPNGPSNSMILLIVAPFTILGGPVVGAWLAILLATRQRRQKTTH